MSFNVQEFINSFSHSGKKVTNLSRISKLLERLDNPHKEQRFVHIAGTNGKGSTLEYMSQVLIDAGYKTGQFTSPFIEQYNDRIRVNGKDIPDEILERLCLRVKEKLSDKCFSQFEITFSIALLYFLEEHCDIIFLETGIGGLLDATNIIKNPIASVITSVSLDHTQLLGNTVEKIVLQKAGIIKRKCSVVMAYDNEESSFGIVSNIADRMESLMIIPKKSECIIIEENISGSEFVYKGERYRVNMCGRHQISNAVTAIETCRLMVKNGFEITSDNIKNGLKNAKVKLRIEKLCDEPVVIADGGHNISGVDSLIDMIGNEHKNIIGIVGMVSGKSVDYAAKKLSDILDIAICADGYIENNIPAEELKNYFSCPCQTGNYSQALETAVEIAQKSDSIILICGSLYLASAVRREFFEKYYEKFTKNS